MSCARSRSRSGCSRTSTSSSPTSSAWRPSARSASSRRSSAARRSSSRRQDLRLRERFVCHVGERRTAPEAESVAEETCGELGRDPVRLLDQPLEAEQVELLRSDADQVPRPLGDDRVAGASVLRSCETWYWSALAAVFGGCAPHSSSIRRSVETTSFARVSSNARSARCLEPPSASARPSVDGFERPQDPELQPASCGDANTRHLSRSLSDPSAAGWFTAPDGRTVGRQAGAMSVHTPIETGVEFVGYRLEELIGQGGMGVVYRAYDLRLKRTVALKLVTPALALDERFHARFARESELAMSLEHPNVVPIYDAGDARRSPLPRDASRRGDGPGGTPTRGRGARAPARAGDCRPGRGRAGRAPREGARASRRQALQRPPRSR